LEGIAVLEVSAKSFTWCYQRFDQFPREPFMAIYDN
jgi:hypothetical protein